MSDRGSLDRLKQATTWMWSLGDYSALSPLLEPYAIALAHACAIVPGTRVLDVAAGDGNFAVAAARLGAHVTACDLTPRMLELGRARSRREAIEVEWLEGDAEDLPVPHSSFDVVASVFGAMFAPRPEIVAAELFRVCGPGGTVAMANYGRQGFLGAMADLLGKYSRPAPLDLPSPFDWGDPGVVRARLSPHARQVHVAERTLVMEFASVGAAAEFWERTNGPQTALRAMLPPDRYGDFKRDAVELIDASNTRRGGAVELRSDYLEVLARKP